MKRRYPRVMPWKLAALAATLAAPALHAQFTWDGGGTSTNFSDGPNWVGDVAPTTNSSFIFAGTTGLTANNNLTLTGADNTITFDATAGAFSLTGGAIRMGSVTNNSLVQQTVSVNLRLNGTRTMNTGAAGILLTALPTSTGASGRTLTKTGSGNLTLTATGTSNLMGYSITAGNFILNNASGSLTLPSTTTVASGTSLVFAQAGTVNHTGAITGAGSVSKTGTGSSTITGASNYTGGTTVTQGSLIFASGFTMAGANSISLSGAAAPVAGTDYGYVSATTGTFSYGGDLSLSFSGTAFDSTSYNLFDFSGATQGGSFNTISIGGSYTASLINNSGIWSGSDSGVTFTFTESTGDLQISAVPEPSAFALLAGLAGVGCVGLRRRRRA